MDENRNHLIPVHSLTIKRVFVAGLKGFNVIEQSSNPGTPKWGESTPPSHFDYTLYDEIALWSSAYYLPIHARDRLYYTLLTRSSPRFLEEDFDRLAHRVDLGRFYANGELDVWWVRAAYD